MRKIRYYFVLILSVTLFSCTTIMNKLPGIYYLDIQQGNIINQEMVNQLRPKMSKRQVLYTMGSPMLVDDFHKKRWDYIYSQQLGGGHRTQARLALFFEGDKLVGMHGDFKPSVLPVIQESDTTTIEVPKLDSDKTLWYEIGGFFGVDDEQ